jgi:hypothetical protein
MENRMNESENRDVDINESSPLAPTGVEIGVVPLVKQSHGDVDIEQHQASHKRYVTTRNLLLILVIPSVYRWRVVKRQRPSAQPYILASH